MHGQRASEKPRAVIERPCISFHGSPAAPRLTPHLLITKGLLNWGEIHCFGKSQLLVCMYWDGLTCTMITGSPEGKKNAVLEQKFWFFAKGYYEGKASIDEIFNGTQQWPGFIPLIRSRLEKQNNNVTSSMASQKISQYLSFVSARASGTASTPARWIRWFVESEGGQLDEHVYYRFLIALKRRDIWSKSL